MEQFGPDEERIAAEAMRAFHADDAGRIRQLLEAHPGLKAMINEPVEAFDSPPIVRVRSREMLDVMLDAGGDINARSRWWAGGFGILDCASPAVAAYAIERGAVVDVHAAARLGLIDRLRELLAENRGLAHARGGDGQTPLHMAKTVEVAALLLDAGADIDARDVDHESTAVQYMAGDRLEVARSLVTQGCRTDLLLSAALGDIELARRHLDANADSIRMRVDSEWFPMQNPKAGGTIYQWTLGFHASAHQIAHERGHGDLVQLLMERSPASLRLVEACWIGDADAVQRERADATRGSDRFTSKEQILIAHAARNNRTDAVRLMLECGLPVDARGQHQATPLHWAAFHGNVDMARAILRFAPPLEATDADFSGTPLGWAIHGSEHGWYSRSGEYGPTVALLLQAGAKRPADVRGSAAVRAALKAKA